MSKREACEKQKEREVGVWERKYPGNRNNTPSAPQSSTLLLQKNKQAKETCKVICTELDDTADGTLSCEGVYWNDNKLFSFTQHALLSPAFQVLSPFQRTPLQSGLSHPKDLQRNTNKEKGCV